VCVCVCVCVLVAPFEEIWTTGACDGFVIKGDFRDTVTRSPWSGIVEEKKNRNKKEKQKKNRNRKNTDAGQHCSVGVVYSYLLSS